MITGYVKTGVEKWPLFAEGMEYLGVTGCVVNIAMDEVDSATLDLPADNRPAHSLLQKNAVIEILDNDDTVFLGDVATITQTEDGAIKLELDGALGWLQNICRSPSGTSNVPVSDFLSAIFEQYNAGIDGDERILHLGTVTVSGNVELDHSGEYTRMLDLFRDVHEKLGGHFFVSYATGVPLVHYVEAPSTAAVQTLEFGRNVLTVENQLDFTDYASRVYATGSYYVTAQVDGHDSRESEVLDAGYVMDADAEAQYGRADYPYRSDTNMGGDEEAGIPDKTRAEAKAIILAEARAELAQRKTPLQSLTMTAADLADIGANFRLFSVGTVARALCTPIGIDTQMMVRNVKRDYIHKDNSMITFGRAPRTLTGTPYDNAGFVSQNQAAAAAPVQKVNGKTGKIFIHTKDTYPTLTADQKQAIAALTGDYYAIRSRFEYEYDHNRNAFNSAANCVNAQTGKYILNCNTFVEMILMGRSAADFPADMSSYSPHITKAFTFGYYPEFLLRKKVGHLAQRDAGGTITGYYGFKAPNKTAQNSDYTESYSNNSYYSETAAQKGYLYGQTLNAFMNANDLAYELFRLGCEIPLSELDVGDILFTKSPVSDFYHERIYWRQISHVLLCYGRSADGTPQFIDCTDEDSATILRSGLNFDGSWDKTRAGKFLQRAVMCARFPIAWGIQSNVPNEITRLPSAYEASQN